MTDTDAGVLVFEGGRWVPAPSPGGRHARAGDVWRYVPNLIGYARIAMCLAAGATIATAHPLVTASLLLGSILLDWVDGPMAGRLDQRSVLGSGVDWLADLTAYVVILAWFLRLEPKWAGLVLAVTAIELAAGLLDFATTATGRYPVVTRQRGFRVIVQWAMPGGSYTVFGTLLWLAYPVVVLAWCVDVAWSAHGEPAGTILQVLEWGLLPFAVLYAWCELAYITFLLDEWREAPREPVPYDDSPAGLAHLGTLSAREQELLTGAWRDVERMMADEWAASVAGQAVFWINIWQRSGDGGKLAVDRVEELDEWARGLVPHYGTDCVLDGYGLIVNPVGSSPQEWHVDYTHDYGTIFVPLTELRPENALQYAVLPRDVPETLYRRATQDLDDVDLRLLARESAWVSVRQLLAPPFSVLKMDVGTIHRGVANQGESERVMFWVSVKQGADLLPPEPAVQTIPVAAQV
jgi:phosphatidylglycerophosphate synthase